MDAVDTVTLPAVSSPSSRSSSRLENLPFDVAYCILNVIATFEDLKSLSLVSKTISQLVNIRLWSESSPIP